MSNGERIHVEWANNGACRAAFINGRAYSLNEFLVSKRVQHRKKLREEKRRKLIRELNKLEDKIDEMG